MCRWCCRSQICWHWWGLGRDCLGICIVDLDGDSNWKWLVGVEACPHRLWGERCIWDHIVTGFEAVPCEFWEYGSCRYPVANSESWVARRRRMKDAGVRLERLLGCEVVRNRGVGAQRHRDGGRGLADESGQRYGGVRKPSALAPEYQGDNL